MWAGARLRELVPPYVGRTIALACLGVATLLTFARFAAAAPPEKAIEAETVRLGRRVDFEKDVSPILEANCLACHNAGIAESKLIVETAESIRKGGKRGPAIVPKNPAASLLFQFASRSKQPAMPPLPNTVEANALSPRELGILKQWILEGAGGGPGAGHDTIQWQPIPSTMKSIESVALSPWGRFVAAGRTNQVVMYDLILGQESARLVDPLLSEIQLDGHPMYPGGAADRDFIHALAFSPDGSLLAAGGYRVVKLWKRPHNVRKWTASLSDKPTALAVNRAGSMLAVATADKTIRLLPASRGQALRQLTGPAGPITALQFSGDGKTLYAASLDKSWRAWTVDDGVERLAVSSPAAINAIALNKTGTQLFTAGADGVIRAWSLSPAKSPAKSAALREWRGHAKGVTSLVLVRPAGTQLVSGGEDGTVRVWDIASGKETARFDHGGPVTAVAVRPDGQVVASAGTNSIARLWSIKGGKHIAEMKGDLDADHLKLLRTDETTVAGQQLTAAEARLKVVEQEVKDREEGAKKATAPRQAAEKALADAKIKEQAAAAAVVAAKQALKAKPTDAGLKKKADEAVKAVVAASEATKTATAGLVTLARSSEGADKALRIAKERVTEAKSEKTLAETAEKQAEQQLVQATAAAARSVRPLRALAFSADGKVLATAGDDPAIQLWDARTGRALGTERGRAAAVGRLAFLGTSTLVAAAADQSLVAWDTNPAWTFVGRIGPKPDAPLELSGSSFVGRVLCLAFNPQGTLLVTGGGEPSRSGELKLWNVPALTLARDLKDAHSDTVFGVEFSRDGKHLASGAADKFVKVFDVATGKPVRSFEGHTSHVLGVSWKADGSLLASAGADSQIKIWNFESGEQVRSIAGYTKQVTSIGFIGTGVDLVSSGGDKTVRLHHTDGDNYRTFTGGTDFMYSAAATRDGSLVVAGGEDGVLHVWNGTNGQSLFTFAPPKSARVSVQANAAKR
ncbi:MAG TPA: c-type cytochrome domain-containing protein [Planctomycetaceae bacterium]|jgi:WD40 repeat protein|nr:c-type cytochrome domain-containing protein [Planctomycetaceae bacterium]